MKRHDMGASHMGRGDKYEHGVDRPKGGKLDGMAHNLVDVDDFKKQAMDTAYGQAGKHGTMSDEKKIHAQFRHSFDDPGAGGY